MGYFLKIISVLIFFIIVTPWAILERTFNRHRSIQADKKKNSYWVTRDV